jgi:hypothetical protein
MPRRRLAGWAPVCFRGGRSRRGCGEGAPRRNIGGTRPARQRWNFGAAREERQGRPSRLQDGGEGGEADAKGGRTVSVAGRSRAEGDRRVWLDIDLEDDLLAVAFTMLAVGA